MKIDQYLKSSPVFMIFRAQHALATLIREALRAEKVSYHQAIILTAMQIENRGKVTPGSLAKSFGHSRANISKMLSDLEARGWVYRNLVQSDARYFELSLSDEGIEKANRLIRLLGDTESAIESRLNQITLPALLENLGALSAAQNPEKM